MSTVISKKLRKLLVFTQLRYSVPSLKTSLITLDMSCLWQSYLILSSFYLWLFRCSWFILY